MKIFDPHEVDYHVSLALMSRQYSPVAPAADGTKLDVDGCSVLMYTGRFLQQGHHRVPNISVSFKNMIEEGCRVSERKEASQ